MQELLAFPEPERWLPVRGWEELYEVSDLDRVRSLPRKRGNNRWYCGKVLVPYPNKDYPMVALWRAGQRALRGIHQLVLQAFAAPCPRDAGLPQQRAAGRSGAVEPAVGYARGQHA